MKRVPDLALSLLALAVAGCAGAAPPRREAPAETPRPAAVAPLDPDEAADLARELDEAGVLIGEQERDVLGLTPEATQTEAPVGRRPEPGVALDMAARLRGGPATTPAATVRADGRAGLLAVSARARRDALAGLQIASCLGVEVGTLALEAGSGAWEHGLGLLSAAKGQRRGLDAATALGWARQGWRRELTDAGSRGMIGSLRRGPLQVSAGALRGARAEAGRPPARLAGLALTTSRLELAALAVDDRLGRGGSLWLRAGRGATLGACEAAVWRPVESGDARGVWAATLRHAARRWRAEAMVAAAAAGAGCPLGRLPAVLPGWDGAGWGARASWNPAPAIFARGLLARGWARALGAEGPQVDAHQRWALEFSGPCARGWTVSLAARATRKQRLGWQGRSPWLPPAPISREERLQIHAQAVRDLSPWRLKAGLRLLAQRDETAQAGAAGAEVRSLAHASLERALGGSWLARVVLAQAWGAPVDLQSVTTPAPGLVSLRHWGCWSAERAVGIGGRLGQCRLATALVLRRAAGVGAEESAEWSLAVSRDGRR